MFPKAAPKEPVKDDKLSAIATTSAAASVDRPQDQRAPSESTNGETILTPSSDNTSEADAEDVAASAKPDAETKSDDKSTATPSTPAASAPAVTPAPAPAPVSVKPSSWASLLKNPSKPADGGSATTATANGVNGTASTGAVTVNGTTGGLTKDKASVLADAIRSYRVDSIEKVSFLEPRGLINGGNMCYMNSVS